MLYRLILSPICDLSTHFIEADSLNRILEASGSGMLKHPLSDCLCVASEERTGREESVPLSGHIIRQEFQLA